jgi:hypothetical protein
MSHQDGARSTRTNLTVKTNSISTQSHASVVPQDVISPLSASSPIPPDSPVTPQVPYAYWKDAVLIRQENDHVHGSVLGEPTNFTGVHKPGPIVMFPGGLNLVDPNTGDERVLGTGAFCKTLISIPDPGTGQVYAVKIPLKQWQTAIITHEAEVLSHLFQSPDRRLCWIVEFLGLTSNLEGMPKTQGLVMTSYVRTAQEYISSCEPPSSLSDPYIGARVWREWAMQLCEGLSYVHSRNIVHCDIKPDNVLLDAELNVHIGDFSSAQTVTELSTDDYHGSNISSAASSLEFSAPELLASPSRGSKRVPTFATDTFSLGLLLLNCATGKEPYSGAIKHITQKLMLAKNGAALDACSPEEKLRVSSVREPLEMILIARKGLGDVMHVL